MVLRREVLSLYRRIFRIARNWEATNPSLTQQERSYIRSEARQLFRQNSHLKDEVDIRQHLREAEARVEIALHYRIPYPRPVNIPQHILPPGKRKFKATERVVRLSKPIYLKSYKST